MDEYSGDCEINEESVRDIGQGRQGLLKTAISRGSLVVIKKYGHSSDPSCSDIVAKREVSTMIDAGNDYHIVNLVSKLHNDDRDGTSIVIDFAYNSNLNDLLSSAGNVLSTELKHRLVYDICCGLKCLHNRGIAHEDMKPDNILLDFGLRAKICDFGHSKYVDDYYEVNSGTHTYKSPEKKYATTGYLANKYCRIKSDIYSLGMVIKEIYEASDDTSMSDIWELCMSDNVSDRPSCSELLDKFKLDRVDYRSFKGVEKYSLSEVERINIAYHWSNYNEMEKEHLTKCRSLIVREEYSEAYNSLCTFQDPIRDLLLGILTFHGLGCEKNNNESQEHLSNCIKTSEWKSPDPTFILLSFYTIVLEIEMSSNHSVDKLLHLSETGNSFAQIELAQLYSNYEFLVEHGVDSITKERFVTASARSGHSHAQALAAIHGFSPVDDVKGKFTKDAILFAERSASGGSVVGQIILDVMNDTIDMSTAVNKHACDLIGDIYFLSAAYDSTELWYQRCSSLYGIALVERTRDPMRAIRHMLLLANDRSPIVDEGTLWMNKRSMLQPIYTLAAIYVRTNQLEYAKMSIMSCEDESIYAMESLAMFFRLWKTRVPNSKLKEEKRGQMSAKGMERYAAVLEYRKDHKEAMEWLLVSAETGNVDAMDCVATHLLRTNIDDARMWIAKGMSLGSVSCEVLLAEINIEEGDKEAALDHLHRLSDIPNAEALFVLGMLCVEGDREKYLKRSAYLGFRRAYLQLSLYYESIGNMKEFKHWYSMYFLYQTRELEQTFDVHVPVKDIKEVMHGIVQSHTEDDEYKHAMMHCVLEEERSIRDLYAWLESKNHRELLILKACKELVRIYPWISSESSLTFSSFSSN